MGIQNNKGSVKKHATKAVITVLIIVSVFAVWALKNANNEGLSENNGSQGNTAEEKDINPDFELHAINSLDIEQLKSYGVPIIIDFGADSCIPCKEMAPILAKLNEELKGKAIIKFVDVWKYEELAQGYPVRVIPTQLFFDKDGNPYIPSDLEASQMNMYSSQDTNEHIFTTHEGGMT